MIYTIVTQPKLGTGQNAFLIRTPQGNILWDLVAYIDDETVDKVNSFYIPPSSFKFLQINSLGGINAIVISHPHFYTTFRTWSEAFGKITVYLASEDEQWVSLRDGSAYVLITEPTQEIIPGSGATAVKVGGHFPGSMILHWRSRIFTADSVMIVPVSSIDLISWYNSHDYLSNSSLVYILRIVQKEQSLSPFCGATQTK